MLTRFCAAQSYLLGRPIRIHQQRCSILTRQPEGWRKRLAIMQGVADHKKLFFCFYWGSFQGNYKKLRIYLGTCSSLNEFPSVYPPPKKYRFVQFPGFIVWKSICSMCAEKMVSIAPDYTE